MNQLISSLIRGQNFSKEKKDFFYFLILCHFVSYRKNSIRFYFCHGSKSIRQH